MGATILVAEEEAIVAADIADWLRDEGARVVVSTNLRDSLAKADLPDITVGIVDHRFGQQTSQQVCAKLDGRGVPFIIYTAFNDIPTRCRHGVIVRKPTRPETLLHTLVGILRKSVNLCHLRPAVALAIVRGPCLRPRATSSPPYPAP
jgi:DNA-binding response OmpR family regulator